MKSHARLTRRCERGAATVVVTLALLGALALTVLFVNRGLLLEARMSANQARSTVAFEAAEAGIEWALAQLNTPARVGTDCRADAAASASFRERYLAAPLRAACMRQGTNWICSCPTSGPVTLPTPANDDDAPAFNVEFQAGPRPDIVTLVSTGCSDGADACLSASASNAGARARIEVAFALVPALATAPAAALTARGDIVAGAAPIAVHATDPASPGIALHTGGRIDASAASFTGPAGASSAGRIVGLDASLATLDAARLFVSTFGIAKPAWRDQPMTTRLRCAVDCGTELTAAIGVGITAPMVWIDGDAVIDSPVTLGEPDRPVAIVVDGSLQLRGAITVYGVVYANGVGWNGAGAGAQLHGALMSESGYAGDAAVEIHRDSAVLAALRRTGSFVKVPGSWRDF